MIQVKWVAAIVFIYIIGIILGIIYLVGGWIALKVTLIVVVILTVASLLLCGFFAACGYLFGGLF